MKRWTRSLLCSQLCLTEETKAPLTCLPSCSGLEQALLFKVNLALAHSITKRVMKLPLLLQVSTWWLLGLPTGLQDSL